MESIESAHPPLYNSRIIETYIKLIKRRYSYINVSELLHYAHMEPSEVDDQGHWFSQEQIDLFYERVVQLTGNSNIAREAGRYAASPEALGFLKQYVIGMVGPAKLFASSRSCAAKFTRSSVFESKKIAANSVELVVTMKEGITEKPFQCENRIGFIESVPLMFSYKLPEVSHPECIFKGGKVCRYIITWEKSSAESYKKALPVAGFSLIMICLLMHFIHLPVVQTYLIPLAVITLLVLSLISAGMEKKEMKETLSNVLDSKEQLSEQLFINYNNALMTNEIGQAISKETNRENILTKVIQILEKRLDYDRGIIFLANEEKSRLIFQTGFGYTEEQFRLLQGTVFHLGNTGLKDIFTLAFLKQEPFLINDLFRLEPGLAPYGLDFDKGHGAQSFICCPIVCEGESLGILAVDNLQTKRPLIRSDMSLLMGIAPVIGISINNSMRITNELQMAEQLRQAQKMEMVGRLAGGIAHDFNNLLMIINGYSEILLKRFGEDTPLSQEIQGINRAGKRAAELTRQLLAYSRRQVLQPKVLDLNEIVTDMDRMLRRLLSEDVELITKTGKDLQQVKVDPGQMEQVVVNLVINARDAMPDGGKLTIETRNVKLDEEHCSGQDFVRRGSYVMLTVRDTGCGMDEGTRSHIFEPFFTTKEVGKGTGLGLATVYGIVKQSGGYILVDSKPEFGTAFRIYLPSVDEAALSMDPPKARRTLRKC
jgi:signal transduction histidine kinase